MTRITKIDWGTESVETVPVRVQTIWTPRPGLQLPSAPVPERVLFHRPDTHVVLATTTSAN